MGPILIIYATREHHTAAIAGHLEEVIGARGFAVDVIDASQVPTDLDLENYGSAILTSPVHMGKHEASMIELVKREREKLDRMPTAFLSVSLAAAGAENSEVPEEQRRRAAEQVAEQMEAFFDETRWHPDRAEGVAGALLYRQYNILLRWVMKKIAKRGGASTDTSRDHIYTDWNALDAFADGFVGNAREMA